MYDVDMLLFYLYDFNAVLDNYTLQIIIDID
jgi:hypothetical protein